MIWPRQPEKLKELQDLFLKEAIKYRVLPLDDRVLERVIAPSAGRPDLMGGRTSLTLSPACGMSENVFINIKNRSFSITADVEVPEGGANGVIVAQAGGSAAGASISRTEADLLLQLPRARSNSRSPPRRRWRRARPPSA